MRTVFSPPSPSTLAPLLQTKGVIDLFITEVGRKGPQSINHSLRMIVDSLESIRRSFGEMIAATSMMEQLTVLTAYQRFLQGASAATIDTLIEKVAKRSEVVLDRDLLPRLEAFQRWGNSYAEVIADKVSEIRQQVSRELEESARDYAHITKELSHCDADGLDDSEQR